jgi:hypothetical protein
MKNHLELAISSMIVASFCFCGYVSAATTAEYQLRSVYRALGVPKTMASVLAKRFFNAMKENFCGKVIQKSGLTIESIETPLRQGLLLKLSSVGEKTVNDLAKQIIEDTSTFIENGLTKKKASNLYTHLRKILYTWLLNQLCSYETTSFRFAITFAGEKDQKGLINLLNDEDAVSIDFERPIDWYE